MTLILSRIDTFYISIEPFETVSLQVITHHCECFAASVTNQNKHFFFAGRRCFVMQERKTENFRFHRWRHRRNES